MSVTKAWGGGLGSGYQCVCMVSILKGGSREVQIRERNCRVSTTSPRILRSDVGASLGKGTLSGSSQRQAGAHQTTHLSAEEGKGRGRGGEPEGWQPPTYRPWSLGPGPGRLWPRLPYLWRQGPRTTQRPPLPARREPIGRWEETREREEWRETLRQAVAMDALAPSNHGSGGDLLGRKGDGVKRSPRERLRWYPRSSCGTWMGTPQRQSVVAHTGCRTRASLHIYTCLLPSRPGFSRGGIL